MLHSNTRDVERMTTQLNMDFTAPPRYPERAGWKEPDTARAAADAIEATGRAATLRDAVLAIYARGGRHTADEVAELLNEDILSIRPRVSELSKQHRLVDTGVRRLNARGRNAKVLQHNPVAR